MSEDITLHTRGSLQVTMVSNIFIDSYMAAANGEFVKIYLYLLRALSHSGQPFSVSLMAEKLGHTQLDIKRALSYWEEQRLLRMEFDSAGQLCGICMLEPEEDPAGFAMPVSPAAPSVSAAAPVMEAVPSVTAVNPVSTMAAVNPAASMTPAGSIGPVASMAPAGTVSPLGEFSSAEAPAAGVSPVSMTVPDYTLEELAAFQGNDEISELFAVMEQYIKRPLTSNDMNTLIFWYDSLHLPMNVIEYLIEYCMESGHSSIYYMNRVAISWAEDGIATLEDARIRNNILPQSYYAVSRAFGIRNRNLIESERKFVDKWTRQYALSLELINEACRRTIANAGKVSFEYADSILTGWHKAGVKNTADIEALDQKHRVRSEAALQRATAIPRRKSDFHNFDDRPIDYQEVERKLLQS